MRGAWIDSRNLQQGSAATCTLFQEHGTDKGGDAGFSRQGNNTLVVEIGTRRRTIKKEVYIYVYMYMYVWDSIVVVIC